MLKRDPKKLFLRYAKKGDAAALGKVFDLMAPELLGLALHLTRRTELAEDVLQDTFLAAAESAQRFDPSREFRPWIIGILVNRARKVREAIATSRLRAVEDEQLAAASEDGRSGGAEDPSKEAEAAEVRTRVAAAIGSLEAPYREVVEAHLTGGMPPRDIAPALGRTPGTVRVQLHRGLEQLRSLLSSQEGIGGLEMLSLAPTSAMMLAGDTSRGLGVIKAEILASLPGKTVVTAGAAGSTMGTGLSIAAGTTLLGACAWAAVNFSSGDASTRPDAVPIAQLAPQQPAPDPQLAPVEDRSRRASPQATQPVTVEGPGVNRTASDKPAPAARRMKAPSEAAPAEDKAPRGETYPFRIEPSVDWTGVIDPSIGRAGEQIFSAFESCRFHARSEDRQTILGEGTAVFNDFSGFSIGRFTGPGELPDPLIVRFDHPDALPFEVALSSADWASQEGGYLARPVFRLDKIETRLIVGSASRPRGSIGPALRFEGEAMLLSFDSQGMPMIHDRQPLQARHYKRAHLRTPSDLGNAMILGIPTSPFQFTDAAEVAVSRDKRKSGDKKNRVDAMMRPRLLPPIEFVLNDPFERPMKGVAVRAVIPAESIIVRNPDGNGALLIEGRAICYASDEDIQRYGDLAARGATVAAITASRFTEDQGSPRPVALHPLIEGATDETGKLILNGVVLGMHHIEVKSPLSGEWMQVSGTASRPRRTKGRRSQTELSTGRFVYALKPPVAGLEIECPVDLLEKPSVWKKAKIQLTGLGFDKRVKAASGTRLRVLIPPGQSLMVEVEAGGQEYATLSRAVPPGGRHIVAPLIVNHRKAGARPKSPKSAPGG